MVSSGSAPRLRFQILGTGVPVSSGMGSWDTGVVSPTAHSNLSVSVICAAPRKWINICCRAPFILAFLGIFFIKSLMS